MSELRPNRSRLLGVVCFSVKKATGKVLRTWGTWAMKKKACVQVTIRYFV